MMSKAEIKRRKKELDKLLHQMDATRHRHWPKYRRRQIDRMCRLAYAQWRRYTASRLDAAAPGERPRQPS